MRRTYEVELGKLTSQLPARVLAVVCLLGPLAFAGVLGMQSSVPADTLFGIWVHTSGYAVSLVTLGFAGSWGFPVIAGVLAGDLFSAEDRHGTWKTLLTRSRTRRQVFAGKLLAVATLGVAMVVLTAVSSLAAGLLESGSKSLPGLTGTLLSPGRSLLLVALSWLVSILPLLAFVSLAILFSVISRNGIIGVLGPIMVALVMQLLALVGNGVYVHTLLVGSAFDDWHGLFSEPHFYSQLIAGSVISIIWIAGCLSAAWLILRHRDIAGPAVARRAGWLVPARTVLGAAVVITLLAAGTSWGPSRLTGSRLRAAITPTFNNLTVIQQRLLGRNVSSTAKLNVFSYCRRRGNQKAGPGDDWYCTFDVLIPQIGATPYSPTPITYDLSVKSNGCYKAESPPLLVGPQTFKDARGKSVTNPLFTIYGCLDPL